jgi:sarcosine oxidase
MTDFDSVVLGVGGVGSAALLACARRGEAVLGIEQFAPVHDRGSSHGETRAIRMAYFEHPAYVPMLRRAYELWDQLQEESGAALFERVGVLQIGPPDGDVVRGVREAARLHGLEMDVLTREAVTERFPDFLVPQASVGLFEQNAGYLRVEDCVRALQERAVARGAQLWSETAVSGWRPTADGVVVETARGEVTARRLLVAAGAWMGAVLADRGAGLQLKVVRKTTHWFAARHKDAHRGGPVWLYERPDCVLYGFPRSHGRIKAAQHSGGLVIDGPGALDRAVLPTERARLQTFVERWLPGVDPDRVEREEVCMYTRTPDGHFRMGELPGLPQVRYVAGLSGHGFKFVPMLGELLAGRTPLASPLDAGLPEGAEPG